jgi:hypothetical protein
MSGADSRTLMLTLRAWLEGESRDSGESRARRIAQHVVERALAGHVAYFRLLLDLVDGKIRPTAEEEMTGEVDCVLVVADDEREAETAKAA